MRKANKNFNNGLISLLCNMSASQNNNENLNAMQVQYYKGILVSCVNLLMKFYNCDYYYAMKRIYEFAPLDSYHIIHVASPESWRKDWESLTGIDVPNYYLLDDRVIIL